MKNHYKTGWITGKTTAILLIAFSFLGIAQTPKVPQYGPDIPDKTVGQKKDSIDKEPIINGYDIMPEFPGGEKALINYINESIVYPKDAKNSKTEGKVIVRCIITKTGKVEKVEIVRGLSPSLNKEAIRIISSLPDWTPGEYVLYSAHHSMRKKVDIYYTLPVLFKLK